ncbi:uncharacterized protein LOC142585769 [Dermacentor variabilis]|uniref:uncharacterized protein LOC142585769 n=1 Tax=Dermacentor variabilis TaxID=34621 RepID=UPI003F5B7A48
MAEPVTSRYLATRTQPRNSRLWRRVLGTVVGLVIGSCLLVLIGMIASMDVFMPSNGVYRNVSHTNMGVLETVITVAVKNIADRYWRSDKRVGAPATHTTDSKDSSLLLIQNRSLAFHEELRGQLSMGARPPDVGNGTAYGSTELAVRATEVPGVRLAASRGFGRREPSLTMARNFRRKRRNRLHR